MLKRTVLALLVVLVAAQSYPRGAQQEKYPLPASVCATLHQVRKDYPAVPSPKQLGELLNRVAFAHREAGFGLSRKTGGNRCPSPVGEIACDVLMLPTGRYWDVLVDAGAASRPTCGVPEGTGFITDSKRGHVAPVDPGGVVVTPPPPPPVDCSVQIAAEQQQTAAARAERDAIYKQLQEWDARLKQAEQDKVAAELKLANATCSAAIPFLRIRIPCRVNR